MAPVVRTTASDLDTNHTRGRVRAVGLALLGMFLLVGCSATRPIDVPVASANEWNALINAGCFSCLREALAKLETAAARRSSPDLARTAFSTSALLVVRARELGLPEDDFMERARFWSGRVRPSSRQLAPSTFFDALALIQGDTSGLPPSERERRAHQHRAQWTNDGTEPRARAALSPFVGDDLLASYVALTLDCENGQAPSARDRDRVLGRHPIPLITFRLHVCDSNEQGLRSLYEADPRWVETLAIRGRLAMARYPSPSLGEAAQLLDAALRELGPSDSISLALAATLNALADHSNALTHFDEVLKRQPHHPDALQGRVLSLSYLRRHGDAIAAATVLIDRDADHVADGLYWRAWNRYQLHQLPDAWRDVTDATRLADNASTYLLAGVIAYARQWPFAAIDRLRTAFALDSTQCEAVWIEGSVHSDQENWTMAGARFATAVVCFSEAAKQAKQQLRAAQETQTNSISNIRLANLASEQLESAERRLAQSALNAATSYARSGNLDTAMQYLDLAARDPDLEKKVEELRRQLLKQ